MCHYPFVCVCKRKTLRSEREWDVGLHSFHRSLREKRRQTGCVWAWIKKIFQSVKGFVSFQDMLLNKLVGWWVESHTHTLCPFLSASHILLLVKTNGGRSAAELLSLLRQISHDWVSPWHTHTEKCNVTVHQWVRTEKYQSVLCCSLTLDSRVVDFSVCLTSDIASVHLYVCSFMHVCRRGVNARDFYIIRRRE